MKKIFMFAVAAIALAACTSEEEVVLQSEAQQSGTPVNFSAYINRSVTRAGEPGLITTNGASFTDVYGNTFTTTSLQEKGFGVFAYYTNNEQYNEVATPNFMYNQKVVYVAGEYDRTATSYWKYEPVKYWPNEFGDAAASDDMDYVTFFAYAPYTKVDPVTGIVDGTAEDQAKNITQVIKNTGKGDAYVKYVVDTDPSTSVDLLWGVANADYTDIIGGKINKEEPFVNCLKAKNPDEIMHWQFNHALTKLNVTIDAAMNENTNADPSLDTYPNPWNPVDPNDQVLDSKTKIYVRSIKFTGFTMSGALNLNSKKADGPKWMTYACEGNKEFTFEPITFYDGLKDGKEGTTNNIQKSEKQQGLNPNITQSKNTNTGVTTAAVNLFGDGTDLYYMPIYVIPTGEEVTVEIVYDVETEDPNVAGFLADGKTHGTSIEVRSTTTAAATPLWSEFELNKGYYINIHLGLTSVKMDAVVTDWDNANDKQIYLPHNE